MLIEWTLEKSRPDVDIGEVAGGTWSFTFENDGPKSVSLGVGGYKSPDIDSGESWVVLGLNQAGKITIQRVGGPDQCSGRLTIERTL